MTNQPPGAVSPAKEPARVFEGVVKQVRRRDTDTRPRVRHVFLSGHSGHCGRHVVFTT